MHVFRKYLNCVFILTLMLSFHMTGMNAAIILTRLCG